MAPPIHGGFYHDLEWVKTPELPITSDVRHRTRAQQQAYVDTLYINNKISHEEWRRRTDELSELTLWNADGILKSPNLKKKPWTATKSQTPKS